MPKGPLAGETRCVLATPLRGVANRRKEVPTGDNDAHNCLKASGPLWAPPGPSDSPLRGNYMKPTRRRRFAPRRAALRFQTEKPGRRGVNVPLGPKVQTNVLALLNFECFNNQDFG